MSPQPAGGLPIGLDDPNSIQAYLELQRKAALVQALQQNALTPPTLQQPAGGGKYYQEARISPLSGIAKLASAMLAKKGFGDVIKGEAAQQQAQLAAFGGGAPAPQTAAAPDDGESTPAGGAGTPAATAPQVQRTNPYNPSGLPPSAALALARDDPKAYVDYLKGTPEWQDAQRAAEGDPDVRSGKQTRDQVASRLLYGKARVAAQTEARSGQIQHDFFGGTQSINPNTTENMTYVPGPNGTYIAQPIVGAADIIANAAGKKEAATEAEKPHEYKGEHGETGFAFVNPPHVGSLTAPTTPALQSLGQTGPQAPGAAPGAPGAVPGGAVPYKPKLPTPPAAPAPGGAVSKAGLIPGSQTTAQQSSQAKGGTDAADYMNNLAQDANGAVEVHRQLDEMKRLAVGNRLNASTPMKMNIGSIAIAAGADPKEVADYLGVNVGQLEAAAKETSSLAVASIHQMTSRGTNFDLSTFMKNNPNFAQTPEGFYRVVDFMDKKSRNIIGKHEDAVKFHDDNPNMPPDMFMAKHTAQWNKKQVERIDKGDFASRPPPENYRLPQGQ